MLQGEWLDTCARRLLELGSVDHAIEADQMAIRLWYSANGRAGSEPAHPVVVAEAWSAGRRPLFDASAADRFTRPSAPGSGGVSAGR